MSLKVSYKQKISKKFSFFTLLIMLVLSITILCANFSVNFKLNCINDNNESEVNSKRGKKVYRYYINSVGFKVLGKIVCRVLLAYFLLFGIKASDTQDKTKIAIVVCMLCVSLAQYGISSLIAWKSGKYLYSKSIGNISLYLQNIVTCLWIICFVKALNNRIVPIKYEEIFLAMNGLPIIPNNNPRITLQTEYVKVEDCGDFFRVVVNGIIWTEIKKNQLFELRSLCLQLHQARKTNGKPLLMLKEIAQAFELGSLKKIFHWESRVKKQGTLLALDFEKKRTAIINELKKKTEVLSDKTLERVIELHKENPFLTYLETREILLNEGILVKMGEVSMRNALERISFYAVRDSLKKQLQKGQMSYKETYLIELLQSLLKYIEKGETIPKAQLINACNVVSTCEQQIKIPDCPTKTKFSRLSQALFNNTESLDNSNLPEPIASLDGEQASPEGMFLSSTPRVDDKNAASELACSLSSKEQSTIARLMLNLRLYVKLRGSYRGVADLMGISASTSYEWVKAFAVVSVHFCAFLGIIKFSGTLCIDDKWIKIAEIKRNSKGQRKFGYAFFAIDPVTLDILHVEVFAQNGADTFKLFLLSLQMKGIYPRRIITDLAVGYSQAIIDVFGEKVLHHLCFFHFKQSIYRHLDKAFGLDKYLAHKPRRLHLKEQLQDIIFNVVDPSSRKTCCQNYENLSTIKNAYLSVWPQSKVVFDCLDRHFEKILNARENHKVVLTNNPAELLIRNFAQHYKTMAGFETLQSARNYLLVFQLVYRFSNLDDEITDIPRRGKCPLSLAGYQNIESIPFYLYLNRPLLQNFIPSISFT